MNRIDNLTLRKEGYEQWELRDGVVYAYDKDGNDIMGLVLDYLIVEYLLSQIKRNKPK